MMASEAQIRANQANSLKAKGPVTVEGREKSRANALKHGLTGAGVVLRHADAAEVERLSEAFHAETQVEGETARILIRRMAVLAVRMDRCVEHESAMQSGRVRHALQDFEAPEGVDEETAERLRAEAGQRALFDSTKDATLARKYEAEAERGFFRALKELRSLKRAAAASPAVEVVPQSMAPLGSFLPAPAAGSVGSPADLPRPALAASKPVPASPIMPITGWDSSQADFFDVPITIGRAR